MEMRGCWKLKEEALYSPCRELVFEEAVVKSDCGLIGEVALDPQPLNSLVNENGITLAGCG